SSFFFQAEDGIRDFHVTGVQTCALPIWPTNIPRLQHERNTPGPCSTATPPRPARHADLVTHKAQARPTLCRDARNKPQHPAEDTAKNTRDPATGAPLQSIAHAAVHPAQARECEHATGFASAVQARR